MPQEGRPFIDWTWLASNTDDMVERILQHLRLSALPLLLGLIISLRWAFGLCAARGSTPR